MSATEAQRGLRTARRHLVVAAMVGLAAALLWLAACQEAGPVGALVHTALATHTPRNGTAPPVHGHKQGMVAEVVSVFGIALIVVLVVALGALSARRRMGGRTWKRDRGQRGAPPPGRGLFG
jgi:hypothetical protein